MAKQPFALSQPESLVYRERPTKLDASFDQDVAADYDSKAVYTDAKCVDGYHDMRGAGAAIKGKRTIVT